jgi:asparagine synthetase B (glutamine-hydrolysing)
MDSSALVLSAIDAGKQPIIFSFTLEDRESSDFKGAKRLAQHFGLEFIPVLLPIDTETICNDVVLLIRTHGARRKTAIECLWPYLYILRSLQARNLKTLATGNSADGHFALSKKAVVRYEVRKSKTQFQLFRHDFYANPESSQIGFLNRIFTKAQMQIHTPWFEPEVFALFEGTAWHEVNKPREKEAARRDYPELDSLNILRYSPLQMGDSGIATTIGEAVRKRYTPSAKSVVSAYNLIASSP